MYIHLNDSEIEVVKESLQADYDAPRSGTLENLLLWGRNRKNDVCVIFSKQFSLLFSSTTNHFIFFPPVCDLYLPSQNWQHQHKERLELPLMWQWKVQEGSYKKRRQILVWCMQQAYRVSCREVSCYFNYILLYMCYNLMETKAYLPCETLNL